jgi:diacylglycerol kinase (ATP)
MKPGEQGVARIISATRYSLQGLGAAWRHEAAFRQEVAMLAAGVPLALWLARDALEFLLLVLPLLLILLAELANSAIEAIVDRLTVDHDELAGRAKDMGSAVVFIALTIAGLSWSTILVTRL